MKKESQDQRDFIDVRNRDIYEHLTKKNTDKLSEAERSLRNYEKPFAFPDRPRPYDKIHTLQQGETDYYNNVVQQLGEYTSFMPMKESNQNEHKNQVAPIERYATSGKLLDGPHNNPYSELDDMRNPHFQVSRWEQLLDHNTQKDEIEGALRKQDGRLDEMQKIQKHEEEIAMLDHTLYNLAHSNAQQRRRRVDADDLFGRGGNYAQELININDPLVGLDDEL